MSGFLAIASGLVSELSGTASVTLGSVVLTGWEVPEKMPFGGAQKLIVHKFPGGGRVVDALGRDDRDVSWSGYLRSDLTGDAMARAQQLDAIRLAGKAVSLVWGGTQQQVVVSQFLCDYTMSGHLLPYSITCVVVTVGPSTSTPTLLSSVATDISSALGLPSLAPAVTSAASTAQAALPVGAALTGGSPAFVALSSAVGSASSAASAASTAADTQLAGVAAAGTSAGTAFGGLGNLSVASAAADAQAAASQATAYLGRAVKNLAD